MKPRLGAAVVMLVALALAIAPSEASQDGAPQVSASLAYDGESRSRLVLSYTVGGSVSVRRLQIILKQPAGSMTVSGSSPAASCSTFMAGDTPGANCDFPGGVEPGTSGTILFDLPGPYTENGGAELTAYPSGSGAPGNPVDVGGPRASAAPSKAADLNVKIDPLAYSLPANLDIRSLLQTFGVPQGTSDVVMFEATVGVTNRGPDPAENLTITVDPPTVPAGAGERTKASHDCPEQAARVQGILTPVTLSCGPLMPSAAGIPLHEVPDPAREVVYFQLALWEPGQVTLRASATSATRDPGPSPNEATTALTYATLPDSSRMVRGTSGRYTYFFGRSTAAANVGVAVGVLSQGGRSAAAGCRWLKRPSGGFVKDPGACDAPRWLKAKGTRRWRLALPSLPPGRYVAYARARRGALSEASFDKRDGNKLAFRVK